MAARRSVKESVELVDDRPKVPWRVIYHSIKWPPETGSFNLEERYWESFILAPTLEDAWASARRISLGTLWEVFEVGLADVEAMREEWANTKPEDLKFKRIRAKKKPKKKPEDAGEEQDN